MSPQIFPEADFGHFSKSLQKVHTANPSEMLSRTPPSKLKMEPRGEKHIFAFFQWKTLGSGHLGPIFSVS